VVLDLHSSIFQGLDVEWVIVSHQLKSFLLENISRSFEDVHALECPRSTLAGKVGSIFRINVIND